MKQQSDQNTADNRGQTSISSNLIALSAVLIIFAGAIFFMKDQSWLKASLLSPFADSQTVSEKNNGANKTDKKPEALNTDSPMAVFADDSDAGITIENSLLSGLQEHTNTPFSSDKKDFFKWILPDYKGARETTVHGVSILSNGVSIEPEKINDYFIMKGFTEDASNTYKTKTGFKKDNIICLVDDIITEAGLHNVKVFCNNP